MEKGGMVAGLLQAGSSPVIVGRALQAFHLSLLPGCSLVIPLPAPGCDQFNCWWLHSYEPSDQQSHAPQW